MIFQHGAPAPPYAPSADRVSYEDIPHSQFSQPGIGRVSGAQRADQAADLIFGRSAAAGEPASRKPIPVPGAFGITTDNHAERMTRDQRGARGRPNEAVLEQHMNSAAGTTSAQADVMFAMKIDASARPTDKLTEELAYKRGPQDFGGSAGGRTEMIAKQVMGPALNDVTKPGIRLGAQHGHGVEYAGHVGRASSGYAPGKPGQKKWTVDDEQLGVRTLNDIQAADDPYDKSEWAGQGGVPARTSAGRPGMPKWLIGGDFVGDGRWRTSRTSCTSRRRRMRVRGSDS